MSFMFAAVAFANPNVNTPANGAYVTSPFTLSASAGTCSSQSVSAMAYSIDSGADILTVNAQSIDAEVSSGTGWHTLHVKSWGNHGAGCVTDVSVNVSSAPSATVNGPVVKTPSSGQTVGSPFSLSATATTCSSQPVGSMAYSIDSGGDVVTVNSQSLNAQVSSATGSHTLHVKAWGNKGAGCSSDVPVNVSSSSSGGGTSSGDGITINGPSNSETVNSPFTLSASSSSCSSQPVGSMAYSLDSGSDLYTASTQTMSVPVMSGTGSHTLHVKSWGNQGAACSASVTINVGSSSSGGSSGPNIPSNATSVSSIQTLNNWTASNDSGASGWSSGKMYLVGSPAHSGTTRETVTNYGNYGDERYSVSFAEDTQATNFVYDGWVYLISSDTQLGNLEMDLNQVMSNGQTVIYGFQCDGYSNTWDYTMNKGTPGNSKDTWIHSGAACNIGSWGRNTWHHIQIQYSRNDSGAVTYQAVWLDGAKSNINATVPSAFALGWGPSLSTNFQIDGRGSGGWVTVFLDDLTIYRW